LEQEEKELREEQQVGVEDGAINQLEGNI